jgi:probable rRNA maturation factor
VDLRLLRRIVIALLADSLREEGFELGVSLVGSEQITRLNEKFLQHSGPTDVISFDYNEMDDNREKVGRAVPSAPQRVAIAKNAGSRALPRIHGDIFICVEEALKQARRFSTNWQSELVRYVVHGTLHLRGFDDTRPGERRKMKREEDRLLRELSDEFELRKLGLRITARAHRIAR